MTKIVTSWSIHCMMAAQGMNVNLIVVFITLFACVSGDPDCERRRVFSKDIKIKEGFEYQLPHASDHIYISQNGTTIAYGNLNATPPTFNFTDDVIRMDAASIVTKHFVNIRMEYKCRKESGVISMGCVLYETHEGPDESEPMNITSSFPDNNKTPGPHEHKQEVYIGIGVICAVGLLLVVFICVVLWKRLMRDHNVDGTPADCRFIRGQLPTLCPRADGRDWV